MRTRVELFSQSSFSSPNSADDIDRLLVHYHISAFLCIRSNRSLLEICNGIGHTGSCDARVCFISSDLHEVLHAQFPWPCFVCEGYSLAWWSDDYLKGVSPLLPPPRLLYCHRHFRRHAHYFYTFKTSIATNTNTATTDMDGPSEEMYSSMDGRIFQYFICKFLLYIESEQSDGWTDGDRGPDGQRQIVTDIIWHSLRVC